MEKSDWVWNLLCNIEMKKGESGIDDTLDLSDTPSEFVGAALAVHIDVEHGGGSVFFFVASMGAVLFL